LALEPSRISRQAPTAAQPAKSASETSRKSRNGALAEPGGLHRGIPEAVKKA
jgi:hypothetical protein